MIFFFNLTMQKYYFYFIYANFSYIFYQKSKSCTEKSKFNLGRHSLRRVKQPQEPKGSTESETEGSN